MPARLGPGANPHPCWHKAVHGHRLAAFLFAAPPRELSMSADTAAAGTPYGTIPPASPCPAQAHQPAAPGAAACGRGKNHHAHRLRCHLCRRGRCGRGGDDFGGRFAGHGLPGPAQHRGREPGDDGLPHRQRGPGTAPRPRYRLGGGRLALRQLPRIGRTGHAQRHGADAGRGAHGQTGGRWLDRPDRAFFGGARHPRVRPPGPDPANRACPGRLPRAGPGR